MPGIFEGIFKKVLLMIVWAYLMVVPRYAQALEPVVAARAGIIWIALALAMMYEFRQSHYPDVKCWGNWCEWKIFKQGGENVKHDEKQ